MAALARPSQARPSTLDPRPLTLPLRMHVVRGRPADHHPALLPPMDVPAAPVGLVHLLRSGRNQVAVDHLAVEIDLFFPVLNALELFVGVAQRPRIRAAE